MKWVLQREKAVLRNPRQFFVQYFLSPARLKFYLVVVTAVEQLQEMAAKRQYKEAAGQLEVSPHPCY